MTRRRELSDNYLLGRRKECSTDELSDELAYWQERRKESESSRWHWIVDTYYVEPLQSILTKREAHA